MVFSSLLFLFFFLPVVLLIYYFAAEKWRNLVLIAASFVFYAWGGGGFLVLLCLSILVNYAFAILIAKYRRRRVLSRYVFAFAVIANLSLLIVFKYLNFIFANLNHKLLEPFHIAPLVIPLIVLPIGISFYTFHALSYLIDVFRNKVRPQTNIVNTALYFTFFPQLIAGPIVRYFIFFPQFSKRTTSVDDIYYGVQRFIVGLSKKVIIANGLGQVVDQIFALPVHDLTTPLAWFGIIAYALQIYFDFSGYIDMAIGLGYMFGFRLPENFNYPYAARSVQDFWRRWNMTLSAFFRDYLYIPLGGSRKTRLITCRNLLFVFVLVGLWHGASWTFIVWGAYYGVLLILEHMFLKRFLDSAPFLVRHVYTLIAILIGWVFFRADSLSYAFGYLRTLFAYTADPGAPVTVAMLATPEVWFLMFVGLVVAFPLRRLPSLRFMSHGPKVARLLLAPVPLAFQAVLLGLVFLYSVMLLANGTYNPFIYFRF